VAVHAEAVDVSDKSELQRFLDRYAAEGWPKIRGVIHAAVKFENELARTMDPKSFETGLSAKLRGAQLLDRLLPDLDYFVLFSSIGAFLPLAGAAHYTAANAGLDALARDRAARGLPALSIAWCPWENTGVNKGSAGHTRTGELARRGILALSPESCSSLFVRLCGCAASTLAVFPTDLGRLQRTRATRSLSLFQDLFASQPEMASDESLSDQLAGAAVPKRSQILGKLVRDAVARVLKIAPERLDPRKPLGSMGLNSLMAMELRNRLEIALDRPLSAALAWNYPTIELLVSHLAQDAPQPASRPEQRAESSADRSQPLVEITAMSDAEAMQILLGQAVNVKR
jgi:acyl carrier protein